MSAPAMLLQATPCRKVFSTPCTPLAHTMLLRSWTTPSCSSRQVSVSNSFPHRTHTQPTQNLSHSSSKPWGWLWCPQSCHCRWALVCNCSPHSAQNIFLGLCPLYHIPLDKIQFQTISRPSIFISILIFHVYFLFILILIFNSVFLEFHSICIFVFIFISISIFIFISISICILSSETVFHILDI